MKALYRKIAQIMKNRKIRKRFRRYITVIAAAVVFITTYATVLPAITLEKTASCGIEEHQHGDNCYEYELSCGQEESEGHQHDDSCYTVSKELACQEKEHQHSEKNGCYDEEGNLTCKLSEHVHDDSCFEEVRTLTCGQEESEGHQHTDACYKRVLVCGNEVHTHSEQCYSDNDTNIAGDDIRNGEKDGTSTDTEAAANAGTGTASGEESGLAASEASVPQLDTLNIEAMLNKNTDLYYYHAEAGEDIPSDSAEITDWQKTKNNTVLASTDLVKMYLAYTIPAGSLNETNPVARYRLPENIQLTEEQVDAINHYENSFAASNRNSKEEYEKYLGAEAVEGGRRPDEILKEGVQEYISAVVKAENVFENGEYIGQDLIFTFVPYSIEKNKNTYDENANTVKSGETITGWFACDFNLSQVEWTEELSEDRAKDSEIEGEEENVPEENEKIAKVIFAKEDKNEDVKEISRTLTLVEVTEGVSQEEKPAYKSGTLTADGDGYRITMDYTSEAQIPENATLSVREITAQTDRGAYEEYLAQAQQHVAESGEEKANVDTDATRFFDIEILADDGNGNLIKIEPAEPVNVHIQVLDASAATDEKPQSDPTVLHFAEQGVEQIDTIEGEAPAVENDPVSKGEKGSGTSSNTGIHNDASEICFEAESFSVYGIVYTVDFQWEINGKTYDFSMPGGGFVSFRSLMEILGVANEESQQTEKMSLNNAEISENTKSFIDDVEKVEFSDPELIWVGKTDSDCTVGDLKKAQSLEIQYSKELTEEEIEKINSTVVESGDWALISMQPFDSEETLTVTMKNGDQFTVKVTDAQISTQVLTADGETYTITVTYGPEAEIPDNALLEAEEIPVGSEEYQKYYEKSEKAIQSENGLSYARFFDIRIKSGNEIIEPKASVETKVTYTNELILPDQRETSVVHFAEEGVEVLPADFTEQDNTAVFAFKQESFSVTGTVVKGLSQGNYIIYAWSGTQSSQSGIMANDYYTLVHHMQSYRPTYSIQSEKGQGAYNYGNYHTGSFYDDSEKTWTLTPVDGGGYTISAGGRYLRINGSSLEWGTTPATWQYSNNKLSSGDYYIRWNNNAFSLTANSDAASNMYFAWAENSKNTNLTVHYGEMGSGGQFVEWSSKIIESPGKLGAQINLRTYGNGDSSADSRNYRYVTTRVGSCDGNDIYFRLGTETAMDPANYSISKNKYWKYREQSDILFDYAGTGWNAFRPFSNDQKDIYVIYEPEPENSTPGPAPIDAKDPIAEKKAKANQDGTYDITLSVKGEPKTVPESDKANVVVVYDISNSMLKKGIDADGTETVKVRKDYTEPAIKSLAEKLLDINTQQNPDTIELSLVMFAAKVCNEAQLDTIYSYGDYDRFENEINNIVYTNGTNWDSGLEAARNIRWKDNDPVYVVFVSDGDTISRSQLMTGKESQWDGGTYHYNPYNKDPRTNQEIAGQEDIDAAVSHANAIKENGTIYSISAFGVGMDNLDQISTDGTHFNLKSDDPNKVFDDILAMITHEIGYQDVKITDGITEMSSSTMVSGTTDSLTYTVTDELGNKAVVRVNQKGEIFGLAINPEDPSKVTAIETTANVKVKGEDGTVRTENNVPLSYTMMPTGSKDANQVDISKIAIIAKSGSKTYFDASTTTASFVDDENTDKKAVEWDLSPLGKLNPKYKYDVTFTLWPKQEAYDILANLNNGLVYYDYADYLASLKEGDNAFSENEAIEKGLVLSAAIQDQIDKKDGKYAVKTNTRASISYTRVEDGESSGPHTNEITDPKQTMGLEESKVKVKKDWDVSLDPSQLTRFLTENPDYQVELEVKNSDSKSGVPVTIKPEKTYEEDGTTVKTASWPEEEIYIAPGVMLSESKAREKGVDTNKYPRLSYNDGTTSTIYYLLETGHNYTIEESKGDWHFELDSQVYHPMVVDGKERDVSFTFSGDDITGITAINSANKATLTATNKLRSGMNIVKKIYDKNNNEITSDNSTFYVKLTLKDKNNKEIKYSDYLRSKLGKSDYPIGTIVSKEQIDGRYWLIKATSGSKTYTYYSLNEDGTGQIDQDEYPIWYNEYDAYTEENGKIDSVGDWTIDGIWESGEVKALNAGQLFRLKNIPYGTKISVSEVSPLRNEEGEITGYQEVAVNGKVNGYKLLEITGKDVTADFNKSYNSIIKNQIIEQEIYFRKADIKYKDVTDESLFKTLEGAQFTLCRGTAKMYVKSATGKVMTQKEVEAVINMAVTAEGAKTAMEAAGINDYITFGNNLKLIMQEGTYTLTEIVVPEGYIKLSNAIEFSVEGTTVTESSDYMDFRIVNEKPTVTVYNENGAALPSTGGTGIISYYTAGILLVLLTWAVFIIRKGEA